MPKDYSLDEFASADAPAGAGDRTDTGATDARAGVDSDDAETTDSVAEAVDPAEATYDHSPEGGACAVCSESATRRWRDDGDYVCADCKEW